MGVDVYMKWDGFGERETGNPNYDAQITGFQDNGKAGYLRISYSHKNYEEAVSPFFWEWEKDIKFTIEVIKEFIEIVNAMQNEDKQEYLDFAELGMKLNKEGKNPKVHISY